MRSGLTLPRFTPNDPVLGARVDEHIRALADHVAGGLTATNLAPTTRLTANQFAENSNIVSYTAFADSLAGGSSLTVARTTALMGKLVAISICVQVAQASSISASRTFSLNFGGITVITFPFDGTSKSQNPVTGTFTNGRGQTYISANFYVDNSADGTINGARVAACTWTCLGAETMKGSVTLSFAYVHSA